MLVPVISYKRRSLSLGETWLVSFQDHTDKLISSKKNKHCGIKAVTATVYYCVYNSVMHFTMTCSNTNDNIYFVIIFFTIAAKRLTFLDFADCDVVPKRKD